MEKIGALIITAALLLPGAALASGIVQIDTTINNVNGGTLEYKGLNVTQLITPTAAYSKLGTPQFFIPAGPYQVIFHPVDGYSESNDSACTGTVADGQTIHCHVTYTDGAPVIYSADPAPTGDVTGSVAQPGPVESAPAATTTLVVTHSGLSVDQASAIIGILRAFGVDEPTIAIVQKLLI